MMSERKTPWTPGPWRIAENEWNAKPHDPWTDAIKIEGDVNENWSVPPLICATYRGNPEANARLIAEAPAMADLLARLVANWDGPSGEQGGRALMQDYADVRALLARIGA